MKENRYRIIFRGVDMESYGIDEYSALKGTHLFKDNIELVADYKANCIDSTRDAFLFRVFMRDVGGCELVMIERC